MLNGKSILVTGGTGSFGQAFVRRVLRDYPDVRRLAVFSRDESKQYEMQQRYPAHLHPSLRFLLGDVREPARVQRALEGVDIVIHAAALKQVPAAEYNPFEFIKTNVLGAQNLIDACFDCGVSIVVALSTDKAAAPANLYGATKLCADKLFVAANNMIGRRNLRFAVVRYGNVLGSRGSVVPLFLQMRNTGSVKITDPNMTRFSITLDKAVDMVFWAIANTYGGEILVPKIPSYRLLDLADAIAPNCKREFIGVRPGEKIHEEMIIPADSANTFDIGDFFAILPALAGVSTDSLRGKVNGKPVPDNFYYHSGANKHFLSVEELRALIREHVDPDFGV
jgi:UDP-N-acetylglucosamine 4,6-dehydratase (inverting)